MCPAFLYGGDGLPSDFMNTQEIKRAIDTANASSRPFYRRYEKKQTSKRSIIYQRTIGTAYLCLLLIEYSFAVGTFLIALWEISAVMKVLFPVILFIILFGPLIKKIHKRKSFIRKLRKFCNANNMRLHLYKRPLKTLFRHSNAPDLCVESRKKVYECMFVPATTKNCSFRFEKPEELTIITHHGGRLKIAFGIKDKVKTLLYGFDKAVNIPDERYEKILLLNPVPKEMYYFEKSESKTVPGGTGASFFGYTAYSGNGFIDYLKRCREDTLC